MRRMRTVVTISLLSLALLPGTGRSDEPTGDRLQYPLAPSNIAVREVADGRFKAKWSGPLGTMFNPNVVTSALAVSVDGQGQAIPLAPDKWKALKEGRGFRYRDRQGRVASIVVRFRKNGGSLKIARVASPADPSSTMTVALTIGSARWCAEFTGPFRRKGRLIKAVSKTGPASCPCAEGTAGTWAAIQSAILVRYGCTEASCHGAPASVNNGNLDLRPEVAFQNLIGVPSTIVPALQRVKSADRTHSVFWLKLAMKAAPDEFADIANRLGITDKAGIGMPYNGSKLTASELEAVRLWIQHGAPETGVVDGTEKLLSACLPPPDPIKITPPAVPAVEDGVQFHAPPWDIPARSAGGQNGEDEVCYATWYDFSAQIPESMKLSKDDPLCRYWTGRCTDDASRVCTNDTDCEAGGSCQAREDCFYFNRAALTQDPNSHHSIIHIYRGRFLPGSPEWTSGFGPFTCRSGTQAGQDCDPLGTPDQCPESGCTGRVQSGVACIGYGPPDYDFSLVGAGGSNSPSIGGSQQPYSERNLPPGVFGIYPVKGTTIWNSHAFNVTDRATTNEQYLNVWFAKTPEDRQDLLRGIFDLRNIFVQNVPPFDRREYCATFTLPQGARVSDLSSHTHKRGILFRIWIPPNAPCPGVNGCQPDETRPPLISTTIYNDPIQYDFDPPMPLDGTDAASRTIKYCSVFDNGFRDPATVKRQSTSPPALVGGPCADADVACVAGQKGQLCGGDDRPKRPRPGDLAALNQYLAALEEYFQRRNDRCDSSPGANDGVCDACPLVGGVTTEDEMYILLGSWYLPGSLEAIRSGASQP